MSQFPRRQAPVMRPANAEDAPLGTQQDGFGVKLLLPGINARTYSPSWKQTETIIRPYPSLSYDNPDELEPYMIESAKEPGKLDFGNWIRRYDVVWKVGKNAKRTFIVSDKRYTPQETPLGVLYNAIDKACGKDEILRKHPTFPLLQRRDTTGGAPLTWIKCVYLVQGMLLVHGSKLRYGLSEDGSVRAPLGTADSPSCLFMIPGGSPTNNSSSSAGKLLVRMLKEENEGYEGDPEDFESRYVHGDPVHPSYGRFLVLREAGSHPGNSFLSNRSSMSQRMNQNPGMAAPAGWRATQQAQGPAKDKEFRGYDVEVVDDTLADGTSPRMDRPEDIEDIKSHWMYWEEVLWFPTYVEQAHELNDVFDPEEIIYAFQGHNPDWIKEDTWKKFKAAVTVQPQTPPSVTFPEYQGLHPRPAARDGYQPSAREVYPSTRGSYQPAAPGQPQTVTAPPHMVVSPQDLEVPQDEDLVDFPARDEAPQAAPSSLDQLRSQRQVYQGGRPKAASDVIAPAGIPADAQEVFEEVQPKRQAPPKVSGDSAIENLARLAAARKKK